VAGEWKYLLRAVRAAKRENRDLRAYAIGAVAIRSDGAIVQSRNGAATYVNFRIHAEQRLMQKCDSNAVVFVARVRRNGELAIARPCVRCMAALKARRVKKCYYTIANNEYGVIDFRREEERNYVQ